MYIVVMCCICHVCVFTLFFLCYLLLFFLIWFCCVCCLVLFCFRWLYLFVFVFFFFKRKPAYEMRISDWSSDVCSSDLALKAERDGLSRTIARNWQSHGLYVQQCHIPRETIEVHAGMRAKRLTEAEKRARDRVELYAVANTKSRDLWNEIQLTHPGGASRQHEGYQEFEALRFDLDSLASTIADNDRLHRHFTKDNGVNLQALKCKTEANLQ